MRAIKTLGLELAAKYALEGCFDITGDYSNRRKAHCKVCGKKIPKGEGLVAYYYSMLIPGTPEYARHRPKCRRRFGGNCICDFRHQSVYVCEDCDGKIYEMNKGKW